MPAVFGGDEAVAFTVFALVGTVVSLARVARRAAGGCPGMSSTRHPGLPVAARCRGAGVAVVGLALARQPVARPRLRLAARGRHGLQRADRGGLARRNLDSSTRATVLSMNSQANAIGQVVGGPPLGALATRTSIPVALLVAAAGAGARRSSAFSGSAGGPHRPLTRVPSRPTEPGVSGGRCAPRWP